MSLQTLLVFILAIFSCFYGVSSVDPPYNVPTCPKTYISLNVSEALPADSTLVADLSCTDADTGPEGDLKYRFKSGNTKRFGLDPDTSRFWLKKKNNADFKKYHLVEVEVYDQGVPSMSTIVTIALNVYSVNDNAPVINNLPRTVTISETAAPGTVVASCSVTDKDSQFNGGLAGITRVVKIGGGDPYDKFWVDSQTCKIYVYKYLEYEYRNVFHLTLKAYDLDPDITKTSTKPISIYVTDGNTYRPTCTEHLKLLYVPESTGAGSTLGALDCSDQDTGAPGQLTYSAAGGDTSVLSIDNSGTITLDSSLDYESGNVEFTLLVDIHDGGSFQYTVTADIHLIVTDVDDEDPTWTPASIFSATISEGTPQGTFVLNPQAEDVDTNRNDVNPIIYGMETPPSQAWFSINSLTGAIVVTGILDRETLEVVEFDIHAYSQDNPAKKITAHITVTLTDENDECPVFNQSVYSASLPEHTTSGTIVTTVTATDADQGLGGQVEYSINSTIFSINSVSGEVTTTQILDIADGLEHAAIVTAVDKGATPMTSQCMVILTVTSVNDHAPTFTPVPSQSIDEDITPGTTVLKLIATDADHDVDGIVSYSLQDPTLVPFFIDKVSGDLITRINLDRETKDFWDVVVIATDKAPVSPRSSSITVHFDLNDINDNVPRCNPVPAVTVKQPYNLAVPIANLTCSDDDINGNAQLYYAIEQGDPDSVFNIASDGSLNLNSLPTSASYTLMIRVSDGGATPLSTLVQVLIVVESELKFTNLPSVVNKSEDISVGDTVTTIQACCAFTSLVYELIGGDPDKVLGIDQRSGQIYLFKSIDREQVDYYNITVKVRSLDGSQSATSFFEFEVDDVNDNAPIFASSFTKISIVESVPVTTEIQKIIATDKDLGVNSDLIYSITAGNTNNTFSINGSGFLTLDKALDAESQLTFTLTMTAQDGGVVSKSEDTTVLIDVVNVDEYSPMIVGVTGIINTSVSEDIALGTKLFKLEAVDLDVSTKLTYSITGGNDGSFKIENGFIYLLQLLDRETKDLHVLDLEVSNELNDRVTAQLRLTVNDVNDNDPVFSEAVYNYDIIDGSGTGVVVGSLTVNDRDVGTNGQYDLTITNGDSAGVFEVVGDTIQTNLSVDYTTQKQYVLTIKSEDRGSTARSSFTSVIIKVIPNLAAPEFGPNTMSLTLDENSVDALPIVDLDATVNGAKKNDLIYSIRNGNTNNVFSISAQTGEIFIAGNVDFEVTEQFSLIVDAKRKDNILIVDSITIDININNINEHTPQFTESVFEMTITEGSLPSATVDQVTVSDADSGAFGDVTLSMLPSTGSSDIFLDSTSGYITVVNPPAYHRQATYYITVVAKDRGSPSKSDSVSVVIRVIDTNDHTPVFSDATFFLSVLESVNDEIYSVRARDDDAGTNAKITYQIASGNAAGNFKINAATGILSVVSALDREVNEAYLLGIEAVDSGAIKRTGQCSLNITVMDVNDNGPVFPTASVSEIINRFATPGTVIPTVTATDSDAGNNGKLLYSITSGNDEGVFIIGRTDGNVQLASLPFADTYAITVTAEDGGFPRNTADLIVSVRINPPIGTVLSEFDFTIMENSGTGTPVGEVTQDPSHRIGTTISYSIIQGNFGSHFDISDLPNGNGGITVAKSPDREEYARYVLTVTELDSDGVAIDRIARITILDENDNPPTFTAPVLRLSMVENSPIGLTIGQVRASDPDSGLNGQLTYEIPSTNLLGFGLFSVNNNGEITVKVKSDYEINPQVTFPVIATDGGGRTGDITVTVDVVDITESQIRIEYKGSASLISIEVPDTVAVGTVVRTLALDDFNLIPRGLNSVKFVSVGSSSILRVVEGSGDMVVQETPVADTRYFEWVVCQAVNSTTGDLMSVMALARIDCFPSVDYLIVITFSVTKDTIEQNRNTILSHIQSFFLPYHEVKIWEVRSEVSAARRRLLAAQSSMLMYVLVNSSISSLNDVQTSKDFLPQQSALQALQLSSDGSPVSGLSTAAFPVEQVMPYDAGVTSPAPLFTASPEGISALALAAAAALALIIVLIVCLVLRCKKKNRKSLDISEEKANLAERPKRVSTSPIYRDIPPVPPAMTFIPREESPAENAVRNRKSSIDLAAVTLVDPSTTAKPKVISQVAAKNKTKAQPKVRREHQTGSNQQPQKLEKPETRNINKQTTEAGNRHDPDDISILGDDEGSSDTSYNQSTPPSKRQSPQGSSFRQEPIIVDGKVYDGVGFDDVQGKPYVYNTKTGDISFNVSKTYVRLMKDSKGVMFPEDAPSTSTPTSTPTPITSVSPAVTPIIPTEKAPTPEEKASKTEVRKLSEETVRSAPPPRRLGRGSLPDVLNPSNVSSNLRLPFTSRDEKMVVSPRIREIKSHSRSESLQEYDLKKPTSVSGSVDSGIGEYVQTSDDSLSIFSEATPRRRSQVQRNSSIQRSPLHRKDVMSRDPLFYDWVKSLTKKGRNSRSVNSKEKDSDDISTLINKAGNKPPAHLARPRFVWSMNDEKT